MQAAQCKSGAPKEDTHLKDFKQVLNSLRAHCQGLVSLPECSGYGGRCTKTPPVHQLTYYYPTQWASISCKYPLTEPLLGSVRSSASVSPLYAQGNLPSPTRL